MVRKIYSGSSQFVPPSSSRNLHLGAGKVRTIIATNESATSAAVVLYDNTTAAGTILMSMHLTTANPLVIQLPENTPLVFSVGLSVATGAGIRAFVIAEAEAP